MIVLDASVAVKWLVQELGHREAIEIVESGETIIAPDLVIPEVMNVLRRKQRQNLISASQVVQAAEIISGAFARLVPAANLVQVATSLSQTLDHSVYDCFYLACAISSGCVLVTADEVFSAKAAEMGFDEIVTSLVTWKPEPRLQETDIDGSTIASVTALYGQFEKTLDAVQDLVSEPFGSSGSRIVNTGDLKPAFDSPAYVKLARFIARLNRSDRAKLLALGWFGQHRESGDWSLTLLRAEAYLSEDPTEHLAYLISKIGLFEEGLRRLQLQSLEPPVQD